jgi:hypothetical protein
MSHDALSHQQFGEQHHPAFEVLHENRAVRMGSRTFPAVWTSSYGDATSGHAIIPMESGHLAHVEHTSESFNDYPAGYRTTTRDSIHHTTDPHELHQHLDELSRQPISAAHRAENQETVRQHLEWNRQGL